MNKFKTILFLLILTTAIFTSQFSAAEDSISFLLKIFNVEPERTEFFTGLNLSNEELSLVFYLYANSDKSLTDEELQYIENHRDSLHQLTLYFGMPPIIFEDSIIKLRHPDRQRLHPPISTKKYEKKYKNKYEEEKVEVKGNNYEYSYTNKKYNITEKIEIKKNKYSYYYRDNNMTEKLAVKYPNYKYEYYYKNYHTGQEIKKEGRGQPLNPEILYQRLKEEKKDKWNTQFNLELELNL